MKKIILIIEKELKKYFDSASAYVLIIIFLLISGWMFTSTIFLINRVTIENFIFNIPLLLIFFAPAISMQLLSSEFSSGTMELLGSLPIKDSEIITGKYLSAVILLSFTVLLTLIFPVSISFLGEMDWGAVIGSYIGIFLVGSLFISIGLFSSSLTSNQIVAFIIGFAISFAFFMFGKITQLIPSTFTSFIDYIGIDSHWENLSRGVIDLRDIVFFLSSSFIFIYCSFIVFAKKVRVVLYKVTSTLLLIAIVIIINVLLSTITLRLDLTTNKIYSLSKTSKKITRELDDPVLVKAFFTKNLPSAYQSSRSYVRDLLQEYKTFSRSKFKYRFMDPSKESGIEREAAINGIPPLQFTQAGKEKFEIQQGYMGLVIQYRDKKEVIPIVENVTNLEYDITLRIKKLTSESKISIGYLGNLGISQSLKENIRYRYEYEEIDKEKIEEKEYNAVIIRADRSFNEESLELSERLLEKKVPMLIMADAYDVDMKSFSAVKNENRANDLMGLFGISLDSGLILDNSCQRIGVTSQQGFFTIQNIVDYQYIPLATNLDKEHHITRDLKAVALPFISPMKIIEEKPEYKITSLMKSSDESWLDEKLTSMQPLQNYRPADDSKMGPFDLIFSLLENGTEFRSVIVSNTRFVDQSHLVTPSNEGLFLNIVDWLAQDFDLINIRSKSAIERPIKSVSAAVKSLIKYLDLFLIPLIVLLAGIYRWRTRELRNQFKTTRFLSKKIENV